MRNLFFVLAVVLASLAAGCGKKIDVVNSRPPVSGVMADIQQTLDGLAQMPAAQRSAYLQSRHPDLGQRLAYFLRQRGRIQPNAQIQNVEFYFGSLDKVKAEDGNGQTNEGYFKNQLVAHVRVSGQPKPVDVIVRCLNGMFELPGDLAKTGMNSLGAQRPEEQFTIGKGDNLVNHVGYHTAIDLAEKHRLELVRGKGKARQRILPAEARRLESETDRIQVAATVYEGDRFDLAAGTYTPAPKKLTPPAKRRATRRR